MKLLRLFVVRHRPTHINKCCSCCTRTHTHAHYTYIYIVSIVRLDWSKPIRRIDSVRMFSVDTSHMSHGQFRAHIYALACKCVCVLCIAQAVKTVCQAETAKEQTGRRKTHIKQELFAHKNNRNYKYTFKILYLVFEIYSKYFT